VQISVAGINYQTAPVHIREKMAINKIELYEALSMLRSHLPRGIILSTCNRTEIYAIDNDRQGTGQNCLEYLKIRLNIEDNIDGKCVYLLNNRAAVEHLFRVAGGLDSMIVGEYEVLGQVRQSLEAAELAGMVDLPLRSLFNSAIRSGRRVREETGISKNALSVSSIAIDLASNIVGNLKQCSLLIIGAGEAGQLVAKIARERGTSRISIANRTKERAMALASKLNGTPLDFTNLDEQLTTTDIIVTCAGAPHRIVSPAQIEKAMQKRPELPLVIIDIGVPRNVEPEVARIRNVILYNIDDLNDISNANRKRREDTIRQAEVIISQEVDRFMSDWQDFEIRPVISALMSKAEKIRAAQLNKTLKVLPSLSKEQQKNLEAMTKSIVTRILKDPVQYLKNNGNSKHSDIVRELFRLDTENNQ
jgi:glutamyl-tRNA reductase